MRVSLPYSHVVYRRVTLVSCHTSNVTFNHAILSSQAAMSENHSLAATTQTRDATIKPAKSLLRPMGRAIADYDMIQSGDRVLVAVSGGKDSLSLLHLLNHIRRHAPIHFEVGAVTVDPQVEGFDPSHLKPAMADWQIPYFYESQPILQRAQERIHNDSYCAFCSRMKRGIMYATARREGYNVLALGQHLDDLAESFLLSAFHGGQLRTMKACYQIDQGDLRVIRPLVYVRERQTRDFARERMLPIVPDSCPACFGMPTQRIEMKNLLKEQERQNKNLFQNLLHTMRPLLDPKYYQAQD